MIRFIVDTVGSHTDVNGNRYFYASIRSTKTGQSIVITANGQDNVPQLIKRLFGLDWSEIHSTYTEIPIREWERRTKNKHDFCFLEQDLEKDGKPSRLLKSIEKKG